MLDTSARLLRLLSLLQSRPEWTGPELAERVGVTVRTLRRDVARLRELGYPVQAIIGVAGGYRLGAGSMLPPLLLDDDEAVAVVDHTAAVIDHATARHSATGPTVDHGSLLYPGEELAGCMPPQPTGALTRMAAVPLDNERAPDGVVPVAVLRVKASARRKQRTLQLVWAPRLLLGADLFSLLLGVAPNVAIRSPLIEYLSATPEPARCIHVHCVKRFK